MSLVLNIEQSDDEDKDLSLDLNKLFHTKSNDEHEFLDPEFEKDYLTEDTKKNDNLKDSKMKETIKTVKEIINQIKNKDLFILPNFDELDELAIDDSGKRKKLNKTQLDSIKRRGEFDVPSINFPGKSHKWRLTRLLQKGFENSNESFFMNLSMAFHLIIMTTKKRFISNKFSVLNGLKNIKNGIFRLIDLLIGYPHKHVEGLSEHVSNQLKKYLVESLTVDPDEEDIYDEFIRKIMERSANNSNKKSEVKKEKLKVPYLYRTLENLPIDLRLYNPELQQKIQKVLSEILLTDKNQEAKLKQIRKDSINLFKNEGLKNEEIIKRTNKILQNEFIKQIFEKILNNSKLEEISPGIAKPLIEYLKSLQIMIDVCESLDQDLADHLEKLKANLKIDHPIKSYNDEWIQECLEIEKKKFSKEKYYSPFLNSIQKCKEEDLYQTAYFLEKELKFLREHKEAIIKDYVPKNKVANRIFTFKRKIWLPKNYKITSSGGYNQNEIFYSMNKWETFKNSTKYPFWRISNFFIRNWAFVSNTFFYMGVAIPFFSKFSFRALFSLKPFYADKCVNTKTGKLQSDLSSKTLTFVSRISAIWNHVRKSIDTFERTPDKGLIGKSIQRIFNRIYNYVIKGAIGTISLSIIFPTLCVGISSISICLGLLSPIWCSILSVLRCLFIVLIYDFDLPDEYRLVDRLFPIFQILIFKFLIGGLLQPICAIFSAIVLCPLGSLCILAGGVLRKLFRTLWDNIMFYGLLIRQARVPSSNTFIARRIAGPGLASTFFYQVKPELVLLTLEAHMEIEILRSYLNFISNKLKEPLDLYRRINILEESIKNSELRNIRLNEIDLKIVLTESVNIVKNAYENSIIKYKKISNEEVFESIGIEENNWEALSGVVLEKIFGSGILTPLEETSDFFSLQVDHLNLAKYAKMIENSHINDDLEMIISQYDPSSPNILIKLPALPNYLNFNPNKQENVRYDYNAHSQIYSYGMGSNLRIPINMFEDISLIPIITFNYGKDKENSIFFNSVESWLKFVEKNFELE